MIVIIIIIYYQKTKLVVWRMDTTTYRIVTINCSLTLEELQERIKNW